LQTGENGKNYVVKHKNFDDADAIRKEDVNKRFFYHLFKRIFDEVLSITALLILSPLFVGVAVLIK
jgi:lipopolysaccharide/colanic/teichoic acid biosynthesis glycosyltransferase